MKVKKINETTIHCLNVKNKLQQITQKEFVMRKSLLLIALFALLACVFIAGQEAIAAYGTKDIVAEETVVTTNSMMEEAVNEAMDAAETVDVNNMQDQAEEETVEAAEDMLKGTNAVIENHDMMMK